MLGFSVGKPFSFALLNQEKSWNAASPLAGTFVGLYLKVAQEARHIVCMAAFQMCLFAAHQRICRITQVKDNFILFLTNFEHQIYCKDSQLRVHSTHNIVTASRDSTSGTKTANILAISISCVYIINHTFKKVPQSFGFFISLQDCCLSFLCSKKHKFAFRKKEEKNQNGINSNNVQVIFRPKDVEAGPLTAFQTHCV